MVTKSTPCEEGNHSYVQGLNFLHLREKANMSCGQYAELWLYKAA